jgi:hypothetical protein
MELKKKISRPYFPDASPEDAIQEMLSEYGSLKTTDLFFAMAKNFICIFGSDGYLKKVSCSFVKASGYSSEELLSAPFNDFIVRRELADDNRYCYIFFCCRNNRIMKMKWRSIPDLGGENQLMIGWEI